MALIVQKFGGTSVADTNRIKHIAQIVKAAIVANNEVVIVVSAMAGVTNQLITLCNELSVLDTAATLVEYDTVLCSGEMTVSALVSLALQEIGVNARSVLAWQLPITTNANHGNAIALQIDNKLLLQCLKEKTVPVVAGFQGITDANRYTTLGRGGSDTTASLIAASINADRCDIYTDVNGVFTADPRIIKEAKQLASIDFDAMLELASSGAKVLHPRSVAIAAKYNVPITVLSSFAENTSGTLITHKNNIMEQPQITGIASNKNLFRLYIPHQSIDLSNICSIFVQNNIHIELMFNIAEDKGYNFIIQLSDKGKLGILLNSLGINFVTYLDIAIVSIVGYGIKNDHILIAQILDFFCKQQIQIYTMQISEIKISFLINEDNTEKAVRFCHTLIQ